MNKLAEKDMLALHEEMIVSMYGPNARITDDEWGHALGTLINILAKMEKMGFVDLSDFDFGGQK